MGVSTTHKHDLKYISVDKIVPTEWNANEEDERTFDLLVDEVTDTGFIAPITVVPLDNGTFCVIAGEHRWRAAKAAGEDEIPALVLKGEKWKERDLQKFISVRMNMIKGKMNPEKFAALYQEMADKYGKEQLQKLFGFVDKKAFNKLAKGVIAGAKQSLPKELHKDLEEKTKDAKTAEDLGMVVQEMFAKYGDTMAQSFMIMTHGKQEHIYVKMSSKTRRAMDKVMTYCEVTHTDINKIMADIILEGVAKRAEDLNEGAKPSDPGPENPF